MNKNQEKAIDNLRQKLVEKSKNYLSAAKSNPSHEYTLKLAGLYLMKIEDELDTIASMSEKTTESDDLSGIISESDSERRSSPTLADAFEAGEVYGRYHYEEHPNFDEWLEKNER